MPPLAFSRFPLTMDMQRPTKSHPNFPLDKAGAAREQHRVIICAPPKIHTTEQKSQFLLPIVSIIYFYSPPLAVTGSFIIDKAIEQLHQLTYEKYTRTRVQTRSICMCVRGCFCSGKNVRKKTWHGNKVSNLRIRAALRSVRLEAVNANLAKKGA